MATITYTIIRAKARPTVDRDLWLQEYRKGFSVNK